jgi:hypothetical protein
MYGVKNVKTIYPDFDNLIICYNLECILLQYQLLESAYSYRIAKSIIF